jgi:phage regulator Rha-like protein
VFQAQKSRWLDRLLQQHKAGLSMNQLMQIDKPVTMSSSEIAELTGKEHKNVIRDVREMAEYRKELEK